MCDLSNQTSEKGVAPKKIDSYTTVLVGNNQHLRELVDTQKKEIATLKEILKQKSYFVGIAAHDIRNPLSAIFGYTQLLTSSAMGGLDKDQRLIIGRIGNAAQYTLKLVGDLLDYTVIENNPIQRLSVDLLALSRGVVEELQPISTKKGITLTVDSDQSEVTAKVSPHRIEQVLNNLVTNACKFSTSGTAVKVKVYAESTDLVIKVIDQGQGIPPDEIEDLFKPFVRTSVPSTEGERSTGLGLAIVQKIVETHHGIIEVESVVGEGTCFTIKIPKE
jgi:signal transduction histidine kinase